MGLVRCEAWLVTDERRVLSVRREDSVVSHLPLDGRVAIVSGANHGIGASTAVELARLGADVAVTYLAYTPTDDDPGRPLEYRFQREQGPGATISAIGAAGRRGHAILADLTDTRAPARVFEEAEAALGPV